MAEVILRPGRAEDAEPCGVIVYEAFCAIAGRHDFPPDFPSPEIAAMVLRRMFTSPSYFSVVAEIDGRIVGSNCLDERAVVSGVGPITIDPQVQDRGVGRKLMDAVLARAAERRAAGVRLVQAAYHTRSLSLYAKLGFEVRETIANVQGTPPGAAVPGRPVRAAREADVGSCNALCRTVHGHDRARELREAIAQGEATVVESGGRITGYATSIAFFGHAVGESNEDLRALISAAPAFLGPGFLVPMRNAELLRWCLASGLRIVQPLTLMTMGLYNEPRGAWLPSIVY